MEYTKFYYHSNEANKCAILDKTELCACSESHEDEYYLWIDDLRKYIKAQVEWWT